MRGLGPGAVINGWEAKSKRRTLVIHCQIQRALESKTGDSFVSCFFLHQIPLDTLQPGFLKEHIPIQLDDQLNIQVEICFGGANGAGGVDVDVVSVFDEVVVDVVEE